MGSELRAVLHFFDDEGYEFITTVDVYSVLAYAELCYDTFEYEFQPKLYTLLIDALNYGAAAQKHFNRPADCPVNAGMEDYQQYTTQTLSEALTDVKTYVENDRSITAVTNMGFTVAFADRTELNVKLTLADGYTKEDITDVAVYDAAGQEIDRLTEFTELSDGRLQVTFRKIKSVNLRDMYYFVAFVGDQPASGQIGYSVEAYAKSILSSDDLDLAAMVQCFTTAMPLWPALANKIPPKRGCSIAAAPLCLSKPCYFERRAALFSKERLCDLSAQKHAVVGEIAVGCPGEEIHKGRDGEFFLLLTADIIDDLAVVHHNQAVADGNGIPHIVGDHKGGDATAFHDLFGEGKHLLCCLGIKSGCMFV